MALGPSTRFLQGIVAGVGSSWLGVGIDAGLIGAVGVGVGRGRHEPIVVPIRDSRQVRGHRLG